MIHLGRKTSEVLFFLVAAVLIISGCKKETYKINKPFSMDFNESAFVKMNGSAHTIKFTKLEEDSRCPPDVYCFWAGEVAVTIQLNDATTITLGHHTSIPPIADYQGHTIRLLAVKYSKEKHFGKEKHCTIRLIVED